MKPRKIKLDTTLIVPIVGDGAIGGRIGEGRMIPVLILDASPRREISELIRVHAHLSPGDVISQWGSSRENEDHVFLHLSFTRPMDVQFVVRFSIESQAILVEMILTASVMYLQAGSPGDRLSMTMDASRILIEVPETGFRPVWDRLLLKRMTVVMARRLGVPRRRGDSAAKALIAELRQLAQSRITQESR